MDNLIRIAEIRDEIIVALVIDKTKCCSIRWDRLSTTQYKSDINLNWQLQLEKIARSSGDNYYLQMFKDNALCFQYDNDNVAELFDIVDEIVGKPDCRVEAQELLMALDCCYRWEIYEEIGSGGVVLSGTSQPSFYETASGGVLIGGLAEVSVS